jgi:hypothetical protein
MEFEDREPTVQEVVFALRCGGCQKDCESCYYYADRVYKACQEVARKDAADLLERGKV